jgi:CRP/FNR family cyclic AMP-dependent transcriptional regulator
MRAGARIHQLPFGDSMSAVEMLGYAAVIVNIGVYLMRTMIPLRVFAVASNGLFIGWAFFAGIYPTLLLNCILLPLNGYRLAEMLILVRKTRIAATQHDFDMSFIRPFTRTQKIEAGEKLFAKGDTADAMYVIESGRFLLPESGIELSPGAFVGELGLLAPGGLRTQSLVCTDAGTVQRLGYDQFRQLFFQNPKFGYYFLQLTTGRLFENFATLEKTLTAHSIPNPLNTARVVAVK